MVLHETSVGTAAPVQQCTSNSSSSSHRLHHPRHSGDIERCVSDACNHLQSPLTVDEAATARLAQLCEESDYHPNPELVRACVQAGANILYRGPEMPLCIFQHLMYRGSVEASLACLHTPFPIDFTIVCNTHWTPLHTPCDGVLKDEDTVTLLSAMLYRIETHPKDIVDWGRRNIFFKDVVSVAAEYQKLHVVWPLLANVPYYADFTTKIPIHGIVWSADYSLLEDEDKESLDVGNVEFIDLDAETQRLCKLSWLRYPDAREVAACVAAGGDVYATDPVKEHQILFQWIERGEVACVQACLQHAREVVDFMEADADYGRTALHFVCGARVGNPSGESVVQQLLEVLLDYVEATGEERCSVRWDAKNQHLRDFLSEAAFFGRLSVVWQVLKKRQVRYFFGDSHPETRLRTFQISSVVLDKDLSRIPPEDLSRFVLPRGIQ